jgi:hypothetical protein
MVSVCPPATKVLAKRNEVHLSGLLLVARDLSAGRLATKQ